MSPPDSSLEQTSSSHGEDAERQHRLDALRGLAEHAAPAPHPEAPAPAIPRPSLAPPAYRHRLTQRTRNRWLAGIAAALCVVVIAVVAVTRLAQPLARVSTTPRPTGPVVIRPTLDHMACPQDAAWSPDGTRVAVVGDNCGGPKQLNIYDAASGKLTAQTDLTAAAAQALQTFAPDSASRLIAGFHTPLWTKQYLFIPFEVFDNSATTAESVVPAVGLLAFNADGATPLQPAAGVVPNHSGPDAYVRWDMFGFNSPDTVTFAAALIGPAPSHTLFSTLPPSLAYQMNHFDQPGAYTPLSYRTPPPRDPGGPIGDPTGDTFVSIWQPGTLTYLTAIPGTSTPANIVLFDTSFAAAESPFLFTNLTFEGRLVPPDQPAPDANALGAAGLLAPWLPIRDSALAYVLTDVEHSAGPGVGPTAVAWRPDGARLAYQPGIAIGTSGGSSPRAHDVRIYDCHSGQVLVTLTPPLPAGTPITANNLLRWSPDGTKLLLLDRIAGEIVIWGRGQLPA